MVGTDSGSMDLARSDDERLIGDSVRRLLTMPGVSGGKEQPSLWLQLAELGALGAWLREEDGGAGGGARTMAIIMAEAGRALSTEPILHGAVIAARIIEQCAEPALRTRLLQALLSGRWIGVLAHDSGVDPFASPQVSVVRTGDGIRLHGAVRSVRHVNLADAFLVTARDTVATGGISVFLLPKSDVAPCLSEYRLLDGSIAGHLALDSYQVKPESHLRLRSDAQRVVHDAITWGIAGLVAETAGIVATLNSATFSYLGTRKQFGVAIGSFQALQHRAADMRIAEAEAHGAANQAIRALEEPLGERRLALIAAVKVIVDVAGRRVGHEAIQMHGGMGVSEELSVCRYARRLAAIRAEFGNAEVHRVRFAAQHVTTQELVEPREQDEPAEAQQFRRQLRSFFAAQLPDDLRRKVELGLKLKKEEHVRWLRILHAHGWSAGWWPVECGGRGWNPWQRVIFMQESALADAPLGVSQGLSMIAPIIYTFGTDAQKRQHLPGIHNGDTWWCQGFSEPNSGSDLASLKTVATRDGDEYVVNGTKLWTSEAHWADMMYCLVRTGAAEKKQQGISLVLVDMRAPGVTVRPIITLDGLHRTNQVFLDNVRVPVGNLVGSEGQGWAMAKFLLEHERVNIADTGAKLRLARRLRLQHDVLAACEDIPVLVRELWRMRIADLEIQLLSLCGLERSFVEQVSRGEGASDIPHILKIRGTELLQAQTELWAEMQVPLAGAYDPADMKRAAEEISTPARHAGLATHHYLYSRCWSIFGGTNEIQRNVIARQVLAR